MMRQGQELRQLDSSLGRLPLAVIARAKEVLGNLEESELSAEGNPKLAKTKKKSGDRRQKTEVKDAPQMFLFGGKKS